MTACAIGCGFLVLPRAQHSPACGFQPGVDGAVARDVAFELGAPVIAVCSRDVAVLGALMPEAPVDAHSQALAWEDDVRSRPGPRSGSGPPCETAVHRHEALSAPRPRASRRGAGWPASAQRPRRWWGAGRAKERSLQLTSRRCRMRPAADRRPAAGSRRPWSYAVLGVGASSGPARPTRPWAARDWRTSAAAEPQSRPS